MSDSRWARSSAEISWRSSTISITDRPVDRAADRASSPLAALEAVFLAHVGFVAEHPGVPRMLFGELQRPDRTLARQMVQALIQLLNGRSPAGYHEHALLRMAFPHHQVPEPPMMPAGTSTVAMGGFAPQGGGFAPAPTHQPIPAQAPIPGMPPSPNASAS